MLRLEVVRVGGSPGLSMSGNAGPRQVHWPFLRARARAYPTTRYSPATRRNPAARRRQRGHAAKARRATLDRVRISMSARSTTRPNSSRRGTSSLESTCLGYTSVTERATRRDRAPGVLYSICEPERPNTWSSRALLSPPAPPKVSAGGPIRTSRNSFAQASVASLRTAGE
jgi:hypothetical protein